MNDKTVTNKYSSPYRATFYSTQLTEITIKLYLISARQKTKTQDVVLWNK